jgi:uncharacterized protein (TIGR02145 family)
MKKVLTIIILCGGISGYAQNTPPYAASTSTWVIEGNGISQIWSDHINVSACNKIDFNGGYYIGDMDFEDGAEGNNSNLFCKADCRNNPDYYYLYSWTYLKENASTLCPSPWRVPTKDDFIVLDRILGGTGKGDKNKMHTIKYINTWGGVYGGQGHSTSIANNGIGAYYWSITEHPYDSTKVTVLSFYADGYVFPLSIKPKHYGYQVRCIKNEQ